MVSRCLQSACRDFEEILQGPRDESADSALSDSLRELVAKETPWEKLDEAQLATSVPLLLGQGGLLDHVSRQSQVREQIHQQCRKYALEVCVKFVRLYGHSALATIQRRFKIIVATCMQVFRRDVGNQVASAGLQLLLQVLETPGCPSPPTDLGEELLRELKMKHGKLISSQNSVLLKILAQLANRVDCSDVARLDYTGYVKELPRRFLGTLEREASSLKPCLDTLAGAFDALNTLLYKHAALFDNDAMSQMYNFVSVVGLSMDAEVRKLGPQRSALHLLQCHATMLRRFYVEDALKSDEIAKKNSSASKDIECNGKFLDTLIKITRAQNKDLQISGRATLDAVLRSISAGVPGMCQKTGRSSSSVHIFCTPQTKQSISDNIRTNSLKRPLEAENSMLAKLDAGDVTLDSKDASMIDAALSLKRPHEEEDVISAIEPPVEAVVIRRWYNYFRKLILNNTSDEDDDGNRRRDLILGVRSLGALAQAILHLEGAACALDSLEIVLEAFEVATRSPGNGDPDGTGMPTNKMVSSLPEYVEALANMIPVVQRWLTPSQWSRVIAIGGALLSKFGDAFTSHRIGFAHAFSALLRSLGNLDQLATAIEHSGDSSSSLFDTLVAHGVVITVITDPSLQELWELVLLDLEKDAEVAIENKLVESLVASVIQLSRQGVDEHFRVYRLEERHAPRVADCLAKAKARGTFASLGKAVASAATPASLPEELQQVVAESDPTFHLHTTYIYQQAMVTAEYMNQLVTLFDKLFGKAGSGRRKQLLRPWVDSVILCVADAIVPAQNSGSPPPGIFRLLRIALSSCCEEPGLSTSNIHKTLVGVLEDVAGAVQGYQGIVATEALEALLAARPEWINIDRWLPIFRRALSDGIYDTRLAQHALSALERWRDSGAAVDWCALLPCLAPYLQERDFADRSGDKKWEQARRRARKALKAYQGQEGTGFQDRATFLRRLLGFIGSLGGECHAIVQEPAPHELQRPTAAFALRIPLAMGGIITELEPALLLPHLAQVIKRSPQRRLRLAGAETLHAILRYVIGSDSNRLSEAAVGEDVEVPTDFAEALRSPLLPLALIAAADEDAKISHLFKVLLSQQIAWFAACPPTASLSSMRDALLEAMRDPENSNLRTTAALYYRDLMRAHEVRPGGSGTVVAKRLLQHLLAAASHVDRFTQLSALQSLILCALPWEADNKCTEAVLQTLKVVVHCLQTSNMDSQGLPVETAASQLGGRLLRLLAKADSSTDVDALRELQVQLWQGAGSSEPAARGFCRDALLQLWTKKVDKLSSEDAIAALLKNSTENIGWSRLEVFDRSSSLADNSPKIKSSREAAVIARSLDSLTSRIDTELWLSLQDGGGCFFSKVDLSQISFVSPNLACQAAEISSILVPWSGDRINGEALASYLSQYTPKDRDRLNSARIGALVALVSYLSLSSCSVGSRTMDLLLTIVLSPATLLADVAAWKSLTVQRHVVSKAVSAIRRTHRSAASLQIVVRSWLARNSSMDFAKYANREQGFEVCFRQWSEHKRGDLRGVAERMSAYVCGLQELQQQFVDEQEVVWNIFFSEWSGGIQSMLADWTRSVSWYARQARAPESQHMLQSLVRFLLLAVPTSTTAPSSALPILQAPGSKMAVIEAFLTLPRPPKEAIGKLLTLFSINAKVLFEQSRAWSSARKRGLLVWLCNFAEYARETQSNQDQDVGKKKNDSDCNSWNDDQEETCADMLGVNFILRGSVLAHVASRNEKQNGASQEESSRKHAALDFAELFAQLPQWSEWAVFDAMHGGADDEDAPILPPPVKRIKSESSKDGISRRVRQSRSDRTVLYQLAALLQASAMIPPVLAKIASDSEICRFLINLAKGVLEGEHAAPRMKASFLKAVPALLFLCEARHASMATSQAASSQFLTDATTRMEEIVRGLVRAYFPLRSHEYARESEEYSTYFVLLDGLFRALEQSAPSVRLLPALYGTMREKAHREEAKIRGFVKRFVRHLAEANGTYTSLLSQQFSPSGGTMAGSFEAVFSLFLNQELDDRVDENIRFALMEKLALPLLWELTASPSGCVEVWLAYWPRLLELADTPKVLGSIPLNDALALELKMQELTCIYGAIEILFIRTPADVLKERIAPRLPKLGQEQNSPSRDITLIAKKALERPPGAERLGSSTLRKFQIRVYSALSAAVCAVQSKKDVYISFLFKEEYWNELIETWGTRSVDMSALSPNTNFTRFSRSGYSFAFLSEPDPRRRMRAREADMPSASQMGNSTLLGANLWGATIGGSLLGSLPGQDLSLQKTVMKRAVVTKAAESLASLVAPAHHRTLAATVARATQGAATLDISREEAWSAPPPGHEGDAARLRAALTGRRPKTSIVESKDGTEVEMVRWDVETLELDTHIFPRGPTQESNLALFLTLLRTFDVMDSRFPDDSGSGPSWLSPFLSQAEKPTTDFWFKLIFLQLLVLRAGVLRAQLFGQHARLFRFVVGVLLDSRFGAEKKLHYFFRDALQQLIVPELGSSGYKEEDGVTIKPPLVECAYDAQRLLHHLQILAPHNESWWQKVHVGLVRGFIDHYTSGAGSFHSGLRSIEPDGSTLGKQLSARGPHAAAMQHSALRQMASFLEFGGFDPFKEDCNMGVGSQSPIAQWRSGLLGCISSQDEKLAAYSCGIIGLIAKWHPESSTSLIEECCLQIESQRNNKEKNVGSRMASCFEQLVTMCPWALCDLQSAGASPGTPLGGSVRRRLITRQITSLQAPTVVLRCVLAGFCAICQDFKANANQAAQPGAWAQQPASSVETFGRRRQPPPRPGGEALRVAQKTLQDEFLVSMKSGDVWRKCLLSGDKPLQSVAATLVRIVAPDLEEDVLFSCTGLMLEAFESMKKHQEVEKVDRDHRHKFTDELLAVCFVVCDRRPEVARGEVAQEILAFLFEFVVHADTEDLRDKAFNFWEMQLSADASPRLYQLCTMLSSLENMQSNFVPGALQLLLRLARKAVEFRRSLLRKPLADCEFKPMQFNTSSWMGSQRLRTFQPASTFASAFRSLAASLSQVHFEKPRRVSNTNRQVDLASVQQSLSADAVTPVLLHKRHRVQAAASSVVTKEEKTSFPEAPRLIRHSEKYAANAAIRWNERQTKAALASLVKAEQEGEDEADTDLIRNYRVGEFPDVLVTVEDILEPLLRVALEDRALGEELLLTVWSGISNLGGTSSEALVGGNSSIAAPGVTVRSSTSLDRTFSNAATSNLQNAIALLFEKGDSDETFAHFLHRLLMRCGRESCASLQLPTLQRTLRVSRLSGVQALEELLPDLGLGILPQPASCTFEFGRHRSQLSALYEAYAELREWSCMEAALAQLKVTSAFTSNTPKALTLLHEGDVEHSAEVLANVLDGSDKAMPAWEVQMASSARITALESLMSWDKLGDILQDPVGTFESDALQVQSIRAELGKSIMPHQFWAEKDKAAKKQLDLKVFEQVQEASRSTLNARLQQSSSGSEAYARGAALLAIHAASEGRRDDVERLVIQGYDSFASTWQRIPYLAASAKHELLSSLPLLHTLELFAKELPLSMTRPLDVQHDAFISWIDACMAKIVVAEARGDPHFGAIAFAELGRRCRKTKNFATASKMMTCCMSKSTHKDFKFVSEIIKIKLGQGVTSCGKLSEVVQNELVKHSNPAKLPYQLLLAKVAAAGCKRRQNDETVVWNIFRAARDIADNCTPAEQSPAYAKLAEFADSALRQLERSQGSPLQSAHLELATAVIECVLKVLENGEKTGSTRTKAFRQAHERLPRVFELLASKPQCSEAFAKLAPRLPIWVVLRWVPQALAHLPAVPVLLDTLRNVARHFPQAIIWPLQLASRQDDSDQRSQALQPLWADVKQSQAPLQLALDLTHAWQLLMHPDMRCKDELKHFHQAIHRGNWLLAKQYWKTLWNKCVVVNNRIAGKLHKDFSERLLHFLKDVSKKTSYFLIGPDLLDKDLSPATQETWKKIIQGLERNIIGAFANQAKSSLGRKDNLELYSSLLATFDARAAWHGSMHEWLEVPGQYSGLEKPDIRAHVRILRFSPQVLVMNSKQRPKRLVILGSDEKEHWFLVKGGEDVRLDARVEQLFESINGLVSRFSVPGLRIQTVAVVPLLPDLGLIQWARDTRTMKSVVLESAGAKDLMDVKPHKDRVEWAKLFGSGAPNAPTNGPAHRYSAIFDLSKDDVVAAYSRDAGKMPSSATLRTYLWNSALGPEAFWHLRQRFAASLAASSAASYILGIGDRHLDNFLLSVKIAEIVPIDFGYSFGVGALLPVPEMLPFRLTNFFLSVLQPLAGNAIHGVFRDGLEKVFTECRDNAGALLDTCAIFLHEPLLDWTAEAKRRGDTQVDFLPRKRLGFVADRLRGIHPAKILMGEIGDNQLSWVQKMLRRSDRPLARMAAGLDDEDRAKLYEKEDVLTVAEQVDCLIRQATDMNVLGRAWEGWAPEI